MRLHFDATLGYQLRAIEAVCDLFRGQESCRTEFTVTRSAVSPQLGLQLEPGVQESEHGVGNRLALLDDELLKNLNAVQLRHAFPEVKCS